MRICSLRCRWSPHVRAWCLGMGMPTLPRHLIIVLVLGPAIKKLGIEDIAVHMFVFYFGVLSGSHHRWRLPLSLRRPYPAPIRCPPRRRRSGSRWSGFVIPFVLVYDNSLLLIVN
ncbi:MAG: TRAP transporter large permease subunit [Burkholderiaceae bacterium]